MSNFEKFTKRKYKSFDNPKATITKDNIINFNSAAMRKYIKDYTYAIFYFDKKNKLIGIELTNQDTQEAYKIRKDRNGKLGSVSAISFLKYYEIQSEKTLTYSIEWNEQDKMLIIDLKEHQKKKTSSQPILGQSNSEETF